MDCSFGPPDEWRLPEPIELSSNEDFELELELDCVLDELELAGIARLLDGGGFGTKAADSPTELFDTARVSRAVPIDVII